jgi:hypothetical protein
MDLSQQVGFGVVVGAALEMELEQHSNCHMCFGLFGVKCWCLSA